MSASPKWSRPVLLAKNYTLLGHISIKVQSIERSREFYDAVLGTIGGVCVYSDIKDGVLGYGPKSNLALEPLTIFEKKGSGQPPQGYHIAFNAPDRKSVRNFWETAMDNGGKDDGKWGPRSDYGEMYYAAFVFDPDGNKLEAVFQEEDEECATSDDKRAEINARKEIMAAWVRASTPRYPSLIFSSFTNHSLRTIAPSVTESGE